MLQVPDADARKSPEVALEISELRDAVWSVARRLPEKYRLVMTLRELQGYVAQLESQLEKERSEIRSMSQECSVRAERSECARAPGCPRRRDG